MKQAIPILPLILSAVFAVGIFLGTKINTLRETPPAAPAQTRAEILQKGEYRVARILDGDTIVLSGGEHIRYYGIDAPELRERWGESAAILNRSLVLEKLVRVDPSRARDPYGRTIADVWVGETLVAEAILKEGYAVVKTIRGEAKSASLPRLVDAEAEAKQSHRGLWATEWFRQEEK